MLGANQQTITTGANFIPTIWSKELIRATEANLVLADKVWRFDNDVKEFGQIVKIPALSNLSALDKVANTAVTLQAPTEGVTTLTVNAHKYVAFLVEDILKAQSQYALLAEYTKKAGYAIKKAVDTDIANLVTGFSQSAGSYNTTLTVAAMLSAVNSLDTADVPYEDRVWAMHPKGLADLRTLSDYMRYDGTGYAGGHANGGVGNGSMVKKNGLVGKLYTSDVYLSTQIPKSGSNTSNMYFHKEALALAMQSAPRVQTMNRPDYLGDLVVCDVLYGVIETRDTFGVEVKA